MLESLFGAETPLAVRFFIAFIVVFALIGLVAWLVRRFGSGALGTQGSRGRAPRLAVIEAGAVDGRRKLVLIRRDNIEHLIMIGGPTDIVVEANIVRGQNTARDAVPARGTNATESLPRTVPLPDEPTWPLQPEPAPRPARTPRVASPIDDLQWPAAPEPKAPAAPVSKRPQRTGDTLAGLAAELSTRPSPQIEPDVAPVAPVRAAPKIEPRMEPKLEPKLDVKPEPKLDIPAPQPAAAQPDADHNLADMAQRLEAALRRPGGPLSPAPAAPPAPKPVAEKPAAPAPEKKPAPAKPDNVFGSLEEEMASLLGRPPGKT
jgi:flagellar protein FliO/FliZ